MYKKVLLSFVMFGLVATARTQLCTAVGQTPVTAVFVCGSETFYINTPTYCGATDVPTPCPSGPLYQNTNPNFFRFACYSPGTLGFSIVPDDPTADYNWQLFDVTSTNPVDIFTNSNL